MNTMIQLPIKPPIYATIGDLPVGATPGMSAVVLTSPPGFYLYNGDTATWDLIGGGGGGGVTTVGSFDGAPPSVNGASIPGAGVIIYMQSATPDYPGLVSTGPQVWTGIKKLISQLQIAVSSNFLQLGSSNPTTYTSAVTTSSRTFTTPDADSNSIIPVASATTSQWVTNITAGGIQIVSQPTFPDILGTLAVNKGGTNQTSYTDGQLLIGNTGTAGLNKTTLTAGAGVTITNGSGSITISATGTGVATVAGTINQINPVSPASGSVVLSLSSTLVFPGTITLGGDVNGSSYNLNYLGDINVAGSSTNIVGTDFATIVNTLTNVTNYVSGWSFTVGATAIRVTSLAVNDACWATGTINVGLYTIGGAQLATATVARSDTLVGNFRYKTITPVNLVVGQTYVVMIAITALAQVQVLLVSGQTYGSGITFVSARVNASQAGLPTTDNTSNTAGSYPNAGFYYQSLASTFSVAASTGVTTIGVGSDNTAQLTITSALNQGIHVTGTQTQSTLPIKGIYVDSILSPTAYVGMFGMASSPTFISSVAGSPYAVGLNIFTDTSANVGTIDKLIGIQVEAGVANSGVVTSGFGILIKHPSSGSTKLTAYFESTVSIGNLAPNTSAIFNITSTTKGAILPGGTTTQKNAISSPAESLWFYDFTIHDYCFWNGSSWIATGGGAAGTVMSVSVVSANGFAGTVATATSTPAITLTTSITGVLKGNATAISAATSGTDYSLGTSALATGILKSTTTTGALTIAVAGDFPTLNQNTTGSAAKWTTPRTLAGNSVDGSANVAFANKFIVQGTTDTGLSAAQFLGALGTGIIKNTTTTGVLTIAIAADFPTLNQNTTGSAATLTTARNLWGQSFNGSADITGSLTSVGNITGGASSMTIVAGTGISRTMIFQTTTSGSTATTALTLAADQSATFANTVNATTFVGALTGNASTATSAAKWTTARNLAGNSVDGSANVTFANKFIVQGTTDAGLTAAQFLGALATGIVKNTTTTGVLSIAVAATDYVAPSAYASANGLTMATARLLGRTTASTGAAEEITVGSGLTLSAGSLTATGSGGTVTTVSVVSTNGFAGTVATATTTPAITLTTTITGVLKGNATAISAAISGTDYSLGTSALTTGILKSTTTTGALTIAIAADFPTLNQNTTGSAAKWTTARNLAGNSVDGSANVTFSNKFIVQGTTDAGLTAAQFLGALSTGLVKNTTTTGVLSIATAATDYVAPSAYASANGLTMATARLLGRTTASTGATEEITVGTGLSLSAGALTATGGTGSVTSVSVVTANGFSGTVATATSTPAITLTTSVANTAVIFSTGSAISGDAANFTYNSTTHCLGIGWPTPLSPVHAWNDYFSSTKTIYSFGTGLKTATYDPTGAVNVSTGAGTGSTGQGLDTLIGYTFTVGATRLYLTHLGHIWLSGTFTIFPSGTRTIGLYNSGGTLVASDTVSSGGTVENNFIYGSGLTTAIILEPGTTWTIISTEPAGSQVIITTPLTTFNGITYGSARSDPQTSLAYITNNFYSYTVPLGPGFKYQLPFDTFVVDNRAVTINGTLAVTAGIGVTSGGVGISSYAIGDMIYASATTTLSKLTIGSVGKIQRSTGTAPSWSTSTFADTYTASNLLYSNGANTVTGLATANNSVLVTDGSGVPSLSTTLPSVVVSALSGTAAGLRVGSAITDSYTVTNAGGL